MLRMDMKAAGLPTEDRSGLGRDFHSLRHSFGTMAGRAGLSQRNLQDLMRHSNSALTARYVRVRLHDRAAALAKLPDLGAKPAADRKAETGAA